MMGDTLASTSRAHLPLPPPLIPNSPTSVRSVPLLGLTAPAVALGENLTLGEMPGEERDLSEIWNVITRAADIVKDGQRLENLCWRIWGSTHPHPPLQRRDSTHSTSSTQSTASLLTPVHERPPSLCAVRSNDPSHLTFGAGLKLLVNEENNFKDWVSDAKSRLPVPVLSIPDTPTPNLEIRLVEPTPVPSRVGSLGASLSGGLLGATAMTSRAAEESTAGSNQSTLPSHNKKRTKFFVQASPTKSITTDSPETSPALPPTDSQHLKSPPPVFRRTSSGSSSGGLTLRGKRDKGKMRGVVLPPEKRQVSLSTMRGRFHSEKRKAAAIIAQKQEGDGPEEDSGWEDDDEGLAAEVAEEVGTDLIEPSPAPPRTESPEPKEEDDGDGDWSDEDEKDKDEKEIELLERQESIQSSVKARWSGSNSELQVLTRKLSRRSSTPSHEIRDPPPPPAPTPLTRMSKKARLAAEAERRNIEADLERQRQREFFAKKQIFGQPVSEGLLAGILKRGNSMVDLSKLSHSVPHIRPSPTHVDLASLRQSPATPPTEHSTAMRRTATPQPNLIRSKSVVALPVATGVSVTVSPHGANMHSANKSSVSSGSSAVAGSSKPPIKRKTSSNKQTRFALEPDSAHSASGSEGSRNVRGPAGEELESASEDEDENYLATSATQRRLEQIQQRREHRPPAPAPMIEQAVVIPSLSPTSRRRLIITREMSESLRRNLIVERTASTAGTKRAQGSTHQRPPPSKHTSAMPMRPSATDLTRYGQGAPLYRTLSHPALSTDRRDDETDGDAAPPSVPSPSPTPPPTARTQSTGNVASRPKPNLLTGGFLRPLTRVGGDMSIIGRTQSSAQLSAQGSPLSPSLEPTSPGSLPQAPSMVRRLTEGDGKLSDRENKRRELQRRSDRSDTSYRLHGW